MCRQFCEWAAFPIFYPTLAVKTVLESLLLWYSRVLPPLFRTRILVNMFLRVNTSSKHPIFFCILSGILCGFPIGALMSLEFVSQGRLTYKQGLLCATLFNQFSPAFLTSYIALECLGESPIVVFGILYGTQFLLYFIINFRTFRNSQPSTTIPSQKNETFPTEVSYKVVDASILSSCEALIKICGYMILCNLISTILTQITENELFSALTAPILELTGGVHRLATTSISEDIRYALIFAFVSFGRVSGLLQVQDFLNNAKISQKHYLSLKILSSLSTGIIAYLYYYINHLNLLS